MKAIVNIPKMPDGVALPPHLQVCMQGVSTSLGAIMLTHGIRAVWYRHEYSRLLVDVIPEFEEIRTRASTPVDVAAMRGSLVRRIAEIMAIHNIQVLRIETTDKEIDELEQRWKQLEKENKQEQVITMPVVKNG